MSSSCLPNYEYKPTFSPSGISCIAPAFSEHRSRRIINGILFFRSVLQGPSTNLIEVELISGIFKVYYAGAVVETYLALSGAGGINDLRSKISISQYVEMPVLHFDIFDNRISENDNIFPLPAGGLSSFSKQPLIGGSGGPTDNVGLNLIRTGPSRTIYILQTTEDATGRPIDPPASRKVQQWNGFNWVTYSNFVQGACPV